MVTDAETILVVDDDDAVRAMLVAYVTAGGYQVCSAADATSALNQLEAQPVDLVLLDLNLPDANGMELAKKMRQDYGCAVIMVTERSAPEDRAEGLECGADDYLPKPVFPRELMARLRKVLDYRKLLPSPAQARTNAVFGFGEWRMDLGNRVLADQAGKEQDLTPAEFDLLAILIGSPGQLFTREQLVSLSPNSDAESGPRSVDILVSRLRKKLRDESGIIQTCRGHGYRCAVPVASL